MGLVALGSSACSDPVPPPPQGAFIATVHSQSPPPDGKACPLTSSTFDVPAVDKTKIPPETLSENTYEHKVIDGKDGGKVSCSVKKGGAGFTFDGTIQVGSKALSLRNGMIGADNKGMVQVTVQNGDATTGFSGALSSPSANCTVNASGNNLQVKSGSMWATFDCMSVEQAPTFACGASGIFVLENCSE
jgi:hypothetical protein